MKKVSVDEDIMTLVLLGQKIGILGEKNFIWENGRH
jgi:hypothetical protein